MTATNEPAAQPDQEGTNRLGRMIAGGRVSFIIATTVELGLPDLLAEGPRTAEQLADAAGADTPSLHRLLRTLAALGLVTMQGDAYALTPLGAALRSDHPERLHLVARYWGEESHWTSWGHLADSIRSGRPVFEDLFHMTRWEYQERHPEFNELFNQLMTRGSQTRQDAILAAYDFSRFGTVADIAGAHGQLIGAILQRYPALRGILFDRAQVIADAGALLANLGVDDRCAIVSGSFFDSVPSGADAYLLKFILHDWDDEPAAAIVQTVARAMRPGDTILVIDRVLPDDAPPPLNDALMDLHMLVLFAGKERTEAEFRRLYERAGLRLTRVVPTDSDVAIVEGQRV